MQVKWFFLAALFPVVSFSQDNSSRPHVHTNASVGISSGESAAKPLFQLVSGLSFDRWFTGIGAGLDQYNLKSIPLFADWRMHFGKTRSTFIYVNGGYNFPHNNKSTIVNYYKTTDHFYGGLYMDAGFGYRIRLGSWHRLSLSAGYSQKKINDKIGYTYPCLVPPCTEQIYIYHYDLGRIVTKVSWEIGR